MDDLKTAHPDKASEIHISEGEALRDLARWLALVGKGWHVVIDSESDNKPVAVISPPGAEPVAATQKVFWRATADAAASLAPDDAVEAELRTATIPSPRKLSDVIALLPENSPAIMDADFARDIEDAIASHREPLKSAWE